MAIPFRLTVPVFLLSALMQASGALPNICYLFEEEESIPRVQVDLFRNLEIPFSKNSARVTENARFGRGCLRIGRLSGERSQGYAFEAMLRGAMLEQFREPVSRMTISLWLYRVGDTPVVMFRRMPGAPRSAGFFQWVLLKGEKTRFYFAATAENGDEPGGYKTYELLSKAVFTVPPGEWNHLAMTFDQGVVSFYLNGRLAGEPQSVPYSVIPVATEPLSSILAAAQLEEGSLVDEFLLLGDQALGEMEILEIYEKGIANHTAQFGGK